MIGRILIALALVAVPAGPVRAAMFETDDQEAARLFETGEFDAAADKFDDAYRRGVALYKAERYEEAEESFSRVSREEVRADARYNLGNTRLVQGKYAQAIEAFDEALALDPEKEDAAYNRSLARALLAQAESAEEEEEKEPEETAEEKEKAEEEEQQSEEQEQSGDRESEEQQSSGDQESEERQSSGDQESEEEQSSGDQESEEKESSGDQESEEQQSSGNQDSEEQQSSGSQQSDERQSSGSQESEERQSSSGQETEAQKSAGGQDSDVEKSRGQQESQEQQAAKGREPEEDRAADGREDKDEQDTGGEVDDDRQGQGEQTADREGRADQARDRDSRGAEPRDKSPDEAIAGDDRERDGKDGPDTQDREGGDTLRDTARRGRIESETPDPMNEPPPDVRAVSRFDQMGRGREPDEAGAQGLPDPEGGTPGETSGYTQLVTEWLGSVEGDPALLLRNRFRMEEYGQSRLNTPGGPLYEPRPW